MVDNQGNIISTKGEKGMKELKISKEKVLEASRQCPNAKVVLKLLFPDIFKEEWIDITLDIVWKASKQGVGHWLVGSYKDDELFYLDGSGVHFNDYGENDDYKITVNGGSLVIFENNFKILKKGIRWK